MTGASNAALIGAPDARARLATPCLLLEADAFERNLAAMMARVRRYGRQLRPHVKAHKCTTIAGTPARGRCGRPLLRHRARGRGHGGGRPCRHPGHLAGGGADDGRAAAARARGDRPTSRSSPTATPVSTRWRRHRRDSRSASWSTSTSARGATGVTGPRRRAALARRIADLPQLRYRGRPGLLRPSAARAGARRPQGQAARAVGAAAAVPRGAERRRPRAGDRHRRRHRHPPA